MKTLIVIPTYNESQNIEKMIRSVFAVMSEAVNVHILVVDDNSPDGTALVVHELISESYPDNLFLLSRDAKMGLGTAYIAGFQWGMSRDYGLFIEMDADFSHNPKYLPALIQQARSHSVVIGSRYVPGGGVKGWGLLRKFISLAGSLYARLILGLPIQDLTGGFNLWQRAVLDNLDLDNIKSEGYAFQIELKYKAIAGGFSHIEHPIIFEDRQAGKSKMSKRIIVEAIIRVLQMKFGQKQIRDHSRTGGR
jgi:dolichol-phosphate mannosyltransferase